MAGEPSLVRAEGDETCEIRAADPERVSQARSSLRPDRVYARLAEMFHALGDPTRAEILHSLLQLELCTCDLASITGLSDAAISQHFRHLRLLHLVKNRREGKRVYYTLDDTHVRFLLSVSLEHLDHESEAARA